jgi:hypothetical protein
MSLIGWLQFIRLFRRVLAQNSVFLDTQTQSIAKPLLTLIPRPLLPVWEQGSKMLQSPSPYLLGRGI